MIKTNISEIENITPEFLSIIKLPKAGSKRLNYLMVMPQKTADHYLPYDFSVGFPSVTAALKASGRKVFTLNLNYKNEHLLLLKDTIIENDIDVVMTSGFGTDFWNVKEVTDMAKKVKPEIITIVGGSLISADPTTAMKALETADYGAIGEGDITVNELAYALENKLDVTTLGGFICRKDEDWFICKASEPVHDMNILPYPDYEGFEYGELLKRHKTPNNKWALPGGVLFWSISRSCPYLCTFCFHSCGNKYKRLSLNNTFKLLDWLLKLYPNHIHSMFMQEELTFSDTEFAIEFCNRIKSYNLPWKANARVDTLTREILIAMKEGGCHLLFVGVESVHDSILKSMKKSITVSQIERAFTMADEIGLSIRGNLIFGDVEETLETFWHSVNWRLRHKEWNIRFLMIYSFPGTELYEIACERGIIQDRVQFLKDGFPLVNISKMSDDEYSVLPTMLNTLVPDYSFVMPHKLINGVIEPQDNLTVKVHGTCPHCQGDVSFDNIESLFTMIRCSCPICCESFFTNAIEYCDTENLNKRITDIIEEKNVAVWAVSIINHFLLLKSIPAFTINNVNYINSSELTVPWNNHIVKTLNGKKVYNPDIINSKHIDTIFVPNTPEVYKSIKEQCEREFPQVKHVIHITELL